MWNLFAIEMPTTCSDCRLPLGPGDQPIVLPEQFNFENVHIYHGKCFTCVACERPLNGATAIVPYKSNMLLCKADYESLKSTSPVCRGCDKSCIAEYSVVGDEFYHPDCASQGQTKLLRAPSTLTGGCC